MKTRIYYPGAIELDEILSLPKEATHHIVNVLRMRAGDEICLFNGCGGEYQCMIESIQKNSAQISVKQFFEINRESNLNIILAQGISRGERMDYTVQKATEMGVHEIQPMICEFCSIKIDPDRLEKKIQHWQSIAINAAEQSGRTAVPKINSPLNFQSVLQLPGSLLIADLDGAEPIKTLNISKSPIILLIGPEGGFSETEIAAAKKANANSISLGPRILRTETAGPVAIALLQSYFGDLSSLSP